VLANAFRNGPANYDIQAGYSHELWEGGPDLRLYAAGYKFSSGYGVYGGRVGAELKTRDGLFVVKYEAARDPVNKTFHTVGGFVNVGLQLSNLLRGENPFEKPEPIFKSPRNLRKWLSRSATRSGTQFAGGALSPPGTLCKLLMILDGPFDIDSGDPFNVGRVPDITGAGGITTVVISWQNIVPRPKRDNVDFRFYDGGREWYTPARSIDMSSGSGAVERTLSDGGPTGVNVAEYDDKFGQHLDAGQAGRVLFCFF